MASKDILLRSKYKLGKRLIEAGRFEEARSVYEQICARRRNDAESWFVLGTINGMLKRHAEAARCCLKAVELAPDHAAAWYNLGIALRDSGQNEAAANALGKTLALNPAHEGAATSLGHILIALHRYEDAEETFRSMLDYQPGNAEFYVVYGSAMQTMGRYEAAISAYRKAIDLQYPRSVEVYENMLAALCMQGKLDESLEVSGKALEIEPGNMRVYSGLLLTRQYLGTNDSRGRLDMHRRWPGNKIRPIPITATTAPAGRPQRLRIGYVSADFRNHSVAYFVEPLLSNHDAECFEITCYFSHKDTDGTTARLKQMSHHWRHVNELDDAVLAKRIRDDHIDILVDLGGHTAGGRLGVFARRAAPVQVSCIGYPDTTGVTEMDYRLSDVIADPPGAEQDYSETLYRLPGCFLCYRPPKNGPVSTTLPAASNGYVTFGSFNNLAKINREVIHLWVKLLDELPSSRLILKNPSLEDRSARERYQALFAAEGISGDRIDMIGFVPDNTAHLDMYNKVDIALDTFPYNGTTTTCEALWMGVPVLTMRGERHAARVGASLLDAVGLQDFVAEDPKHLIRIARAKTADLGQLATLRASLRDCMRSSRLCAEVKYTQAVETAYDAMFAGRQ